MLIFLWINCNRKLQLFVLHHEGQLCVCIGSKHVPNYIFIGCVLEHQLKNNKHFQPSRPYNPDQDAPKACYKKYDFSLLNQFGLFVNIGQACDIFRQPLFCISVAELEMYDHLFLLCLQSAVL